MNSKEENKSVNNKGSNKGSRTEVKINSVFSNPINTKSAIPSPRTSANRLYSGYSNQNFSKQLKY